MSDINLVNVNNNTSFLNVTTVDNVEMIVNVDSIFSINTNPDGNTVINFTDESVITVNVPFATIWNWFTNVNNTLLTQTA